jgi:septal ring factor EnvC (AmiA/AmiB activator)
MYRLKIDYINKYYSKKDIEKFLYNEELFSINNIYINYKYNTENNYNNIIINVKEWYNTSKAKYTYNYLQENNKNFIEVITPDKDIWTLRKYDNIIENNKNDISTLKYKLNSLENTIKELVEKLKNQNTKIIEQDNKLNYLKINQDNIKVGIKRKRQVTFTS